MNITILCGNLTRDIELINIASGLAIGKTSIAVNERIKSGDEWVEKPCFVDLVAFGKTAENMAKFFRKGSKVLINGKLSWSSWEDKNSGVKRSKLEVIVDRFEFVEPRKSGEQAEQSNSLPPRNAMPPRPPTPEALMPDDIPF